jgi:hypothetical protein
MKNDEEKENNKKRLISELENKEELVTNEDIETIKFQLTKKNFINPQKILKRYNNYLNNKKM